MFAAKSYCSEEVTIFFKDPEEVIYNNDIGIFRQKSANSSDEADEDNKDLMSDCDTDVEDTLKASGLQKSKPVVQIVKKALEGTCIVILLLRLHLNNNFVGNLCTKLNY